MFIEAKTQQEVVQKFSFIKNKSQAQKEIEYFIADLVIDVSEAYGDKIDFMILYGSAAKGNFVKGASDIDLAIQVKNEADVPEITEYATNVFWQLDQTHNIGFSDYLANADTTNKIEKIFRKAENKAMLYTPLFVLGPEEMNWEEGKVVKKDWAFLSKLFVSTGTMFAKFKKEGIVLYGRDIKQEINVNLSFWERWKGICIPVYFALLAIAILPLVYKRSVKYSTKALLWGIESALTYMKNLVSERDAQLSELKQLAQKDIEIHQLSRFIDLNLHMNYSLLPEDQFQIIFEAVDYKHNGFDKGFKAAASFVLRAFIFLIRLNFIVLARS